MNNSSAAVSFSVARKLKNELDEERPRAARRRHTSVATAKCAEGRVCYLTALGQGQYAVTPDKQ